MKRKLRWALALFGLAFIYFLAATGWLSKPRPWRETAGVDQLVQPAFYSNQGELRIHALGHAGFLLEWHGQHIALDPNLSTSCFPVKRLSSLTQASWPMLAETCVISHAHYDHLDLPTLSRLAGLERMIAPAGLNDFLPKTLLSRLEFIGLHEGESATVGDLRVTAVYARHRGGRSHPLPSVYQALGYVIGDGHTNMYFAGDSGYGPHFAEIGARFHPSIAILPIGAYAPHFILAPHHMNPEEAVRAGLDLGSELVIPCHFGTFRLAFDAADSALPRFAAAADAAGLNWRLAPMLGDAEEGK